MTERLHFHFSLSCIGEGNGNLLQCSCLENPRDRGAWWAAIYGVAQSRTRLKWLSSSSSTVCEALTIHHCRKYRTAFVKVSQEFYFKQNEPLFLNSWYLLAASVKEVILQQIKTCVSLTKHSVCFQLENFEVLLSQSLSKISKMRDFRDGAVVKTSFQSRGFGCGPWSGS